MSDLIYPCDQEINNLADAYYAEHVINNNDTKVSPPVLRYDTRDDCPGDDFPVVETRRSTPYRIIKNWIKKFNILVSPRRFLSGEPSRQKER